MSDEQNQDIPNWQQPMPPAQQDENEGPVREQDQDHEEVDVRDRVIAELRDNIENMQVKLEKQNNEIIALMTEASLIADVVSANNEIDLSCFTPEDKCIVIDPESAYFQQLGVLQSEPDDEGKVQVELSNGLRRLFRVGVDEQAEIKLIGKDDGTNVVVATGGEHYEVFGIPGLDISPGDAVKVNMKSKQIVGVADVSRMGEIAVVAAVLENNTLEVAINGNTQIVLAGPKKYEEVEPEQIPDVESEDGEVAELAVEVEPLIDGMNLVEVPLKVGDRVQLDKAATCVIRHLPPEDNGYKVSERLAVTFDDIAGCEEAKVSIREALLYPTTHAELYELYGKKQSKGMLLHGAPGNGKTLLGKAMHSMLCELHGDGSEEGMASGFIYVKGPELLSKWVGNSEASIRSLFARGKEHYEKNGWPALLFIDEADAILPQRGRREGGFDIADTTVPMFLSEMDGLEESNVFVVLATNRPGLLDPAVIREGRCDSHIKVDRPTEDSAMDYFIIHSKNVPLEGQPDKGDESYSEARHQLIQNFAAIATADIFSSSRTLYKIKNGAEDHVMHMRDILSGAMVQGIVQKAVTLAMRRNMESEDTAVTGVTAQDFRNSVEEVYRSHIGQNHNFDVEDFCEKNDIDRAKVSVSVHAQKKS